MKKRAFSFLVALCLMLTLLPATALADTTVTADTSWYSADGTTFEISDAADLLGFVKLVNVVNPVAEVNNKGYATLQDAVDAATNGDTITVLRDIVIDIPEDKLNQDFTFVTITDKTITLNLNGKSISWSDVVKTQTNDIWDDVIALNDSANLTITGNGTIDAYVNSTVCGNVVSLNKNVNAQLTIKNGTYTGMTIFWVGNNGGKIFIEGGYFSDPSYDGHCQLFNVSGYLGFGTGKEIVMTGGTLDCRDPRYLNDGNAVAEGYVVRKVTKANGKREYTVIPESEALGFYTATTADYDWNHNNNKQSWQNKYDEEFPAKSRFAYTAEDAVAKIGDTYYRTLYSAVYASKSGDTVTVIKDIEIGLSEFVL